MTKPDLKLTSFICTVLKGTSTAMSSAWHGLAFCHVNELRKERLLFALCITSEWSVQGLIPYANIARHPMAYIIISRSAMRDSMCNEHA